MRHVLKYWTGYKARMRHEIHQHMVKKKVIMESAYNPPVPGGEQNV